MWATFSNRFNSLNLIDYPRDFFFHYLDDAVTNIGENNHKDPDMKALLVMALIFSSSAFANVREMMTFELIEVTIQEMASARKNLKMKVECVGDKRFDDISFQSSWFHLPKNLGKGELTLKKSGVDIQIGPEFFQNCSGFNQVILSVEDHGYFGSTTLIEKDIYRLLYSKHSPLKPGGSVALKLNGDIGARIRVRSKLVRY